MKLYVSGGITGVPNYEETFSLAAEGLKNVGYEVVNSVLTDTCTPRSPGKAGPCVSLEEVERGELHSWQCYMRYTIRDMLLCDGIAMLRNHEKSRGARLELFLAGQVGMEIGTVRYWLLNAGMSAGPL